MVKPLAYLCQRRADPIIAQGFTRCFEAACARQGLPPALDATSPIRQRVGQVLSRLRLLRDLHLPKARAVVGLVGQVSEFRWFPLAYRCEIIPYCFDTWPGRFDQWLGFFRRHRVRTAAFTARLAMQRLLERQPSLQARWFPEACDPDDFDATRPLRDREIDVLEFGRRLDAAHHALRSALPAHRVHVFSRAGEARLRTLDDLRLALTDARVTVVYPRSTTDPQVAGDIETVTLRYFEGMASGCVLAGQAPAELVDLFGFDPVVSASPSEIVDVVNDVAEHPDRYQPAVERNLRRLREVGTWDVRVRELLCWLRELGYGH